MTSLRVRSSVGFPRYGVPAGATDRIQSLIPGISDCNREYADPNGLTEGSHLGLEGLDLGSVSVLSIEHFFYGGLPRRFLFHRPDTSCSGNDSSRSPDVLGRDGRPPSALPFSEGRIDTHRQPRSNVVAAVRRVVTPGAGLLRSARRSSRSARRAAIWSAGSAIMTPSSAARLCPILSLGSPSACTP